MLLKLLLEQTGQSWTLKPSRQYVIGSAQDADIALPYTEVLSGHHLKLSFDPTSASWYVDDLDSSQGTFVEGQPITRYPISQQVRITIGSIALVAKPADVPGTTPATTVAAPPLYQPQPPQYPPPTAAAKPAQPPQYPPPAAAGKPTVRQGGSAISKGSTAIAMLTWPQFVEQQVNKFEGLKRIAVRFAMVTGFRWTPWIRKPESNGFEAFDGYILPNVNEPAEKIAAGIEEKLGQLTRYDDTDCFISWLTDAHIINSGTKEFKGVELFPIRRGGKADFRRFCVMSYHRVRTYLLVENYGTDLFVSWVTRFEPDPTSGFMILWLLLAVFLTIPLLLTRSAFIVLAPIAIWCAIYLLVPALMSSQGILPKEANGRLIIALVVIPLVILLIIGSAIPM